MENLKTKKILIFGTGAVGGYYGGMLVKAGFDVTFIARGKNHEILKKNGLTLIRDDKKEVLPINVIEALYATSLFDYIFICVKSKDTKDAAEKIRNNIAPNTTIISLQNGVENEDIIGSVIGIEKVVGGLAFVASKLVGPGIVYQFGRSGCMVGELDSGVTKRILELQKIFQSSGIDCKVSGNMRAELWNKLVWNASFNSVSVLTGKTVDKILEEDYNLIKNIMTEVKSVAITLGVNIQSDTVEFNLARSHGFAGFKTSMLQDYEKGNPIELEELVGVVIKKAKEKNFSVPYIEKVYSEIRQKLAVRV